MNTIPLTLRTLDLPLSPTREHEHGWLTESVHRTSEGVIRYVRCVDCGARRVDLDATHSLRAW